VKNIDNHPNAKATKVMKKSSTRMQKWKKVCSRRVYSLTYHFKY